jgi:hypothetical protein
MSRKSLLTLSLLLPLMAIPGAAYANHNYQHRPNEPFRHSHGESVGYGAYMMEGRSVFAPAVPGTIGDQQHYRYRGEPKSQFVPSR